MSLRFVPPPLNPTQLSFHAAPSTEVSPPTTPLACLRFPSMPSKVCAMLHPCGTIMAAVIGWPLACCTPAPSSPLACRAHVHVTTVLGFTPLPRLPRPRGPFLPRLPWHHLPVGAFNPINLRVDCIEAYHGGDALGSQVASGVWVGACFACSLLELTAGMCCLCSRNGLPAQRGLPACLPSARCLPACMPRAACLPSAGCLLRAARCLPARCALAARLPSARCMPPAARCLPARCALPARLPSARCLPPPARCLPARCALPARLPSARCMLPAARCLPARCALPAKGG
jgi:hypothetical protein